MFARILPRGRIDLPPLIIAGTLFLEVFTVQMIDHWIFRGGAPHTHVHARLKISQEIDARFQQGILMLHAKQHEHALTAFHRVLELNPTMPEAHVNIGFAFLGMNKYKEARDFFATALSLRPQQINAYYGTALAAYGMGERQDAMHAMYHYISLADAGDPFRTKAEDLLDTWRKEPKPAGTARPKGAAREKSALTQRRPEPERP